MADSTSHPLHRAWDLWLSRWKGKVTVQLKGRFDTIEGFWVSLNQHPVSNLRDKQHLHVFQDGIPPLWEDPANASGGHFKITARTYDATVAIWQSIVLHMIGEQCPTDVFVNGVLFIFHTVGDSIVKVWVPTVDKAIVEMTKSFLEDAILSAGPSAAAERLVFVPHKLVLGSTKKPTDDLLLRPLHENGDLRRFQAAYAGSGPKRFVIGTRSQADRPPEEMSDDGRGSMHGSDALETLSSLPDSLISLPRREPPKPPTALVPAGSNPLDVAFARLCSRFC